jgi:hypothetical protein
MRFSTSVFFIKQLPLGPWYTGYSLFEYDFELAKIIDKVGCTAVSLTPLCNILFSYIFANNSTHCFFTRISDSSTVHTAQQCHWHRCDMHSSVIDTPVTCTAESLTTLWHAQRSHWHRCDMHSGNCCDMHSGVNDTAVQIWLRCDLEPNIRVALATFKGNIYQKNIHRQIVMHFTYNFQTKNMGVNSDRFFVTVV